MKYLAITMISLTCLVVGCKTIEEPEVIVRHTFGSNLPPLGDAVPLGDTSAPAYEAGQWYVWDSEVAAAGALGYINRTTWFPMAGRNADDGSTGEGTTAKWAPAVKELTDGRWGFPRIPERVMDHLQVPVEDRNAFWMAFGPEAVVVTIDMIKREGE